MCTWGRWRSSYVRIAIFCPPPTPWHVNGVPRSLIPPVSSRWRSPDQSCSLLGLLDRIVARLAEGLPVGLIPEEILVTSVRNDVVDDAGCSRSSLPGAVGAQRVVTEVLLSRLLPSVVVATLGAGHAAPPTAWRDYLHPRPCALLDARAERLEPGHQPCALRDRNRSE